MTEQYRVPSLTVRNVRRGLRNPRAALTHGLKALRAAYYGARYDDYIERYLAQTKRNVRSNPAGAVGPAELFEEMREWQFRFLVDECGLRQSDVFLDLGCGVLRGGLPLVEYLDEGNYYGMDISVEALAVGRDAIEDAGLEERSPTLINNNDLTFQEPELPGSVDVVWAQSVLTHLTPRLLVELLDNLRRILSADGRMYATWYEANRDAVVKRPSGIGFEYPLDYISREAARNGLTVGRVTPSTEHPNGLKTLEVQRD